jgi:hypothetical protein
MMDIARAEAFCSSYGKAMESGDPAALAGHYGFPYVSFTLGYVSRFESRAEADAAVGSHVARFDRRGLGTDIRLEGARVEPVADGSALCHLRWAIYPQDDTPGWSWDNVYGLRQSADVQHFEFNISDNEIGELLARFPDFMSG